MKEQEARLEQRIAVHRPVALQVEPQKQVEAALGALDRLTELVAAGAADWSAVGGAFDRTNAKLYLRFAAVE